MAKKTKSYGLNNPLQDTFPSPVKAQRAPKSSDTGYEIGQTWVDIPNKTAYILADVSAGSATWNISASGSGDLETLTGDSGGAISPVSGNINMAGGTAITSVGSGDTVTFNLDETFTITGDVNIIDNLPVGGVNLNVENTDNTVGSSVAQIKIKTGGAVGGNPSFRLEVNGGAVFLMALNNSVNDNFVISNGNSVGVNNALSINSTNNDFSVFSNLMLETAASQIQIKGGAVTDFIGQATLVAGRVTVANTNIAATDRIFVTRSGVGASTTLGILDISIIAATDFTITSLQPATPGSTEAGDLSIVNYLIIRQI